MTVHWSSSVTGDGQPKNACQHPSNTSGAAQQSITESEVPHHRGDSHEVPDAAQEEYRPNKKAKIEDMKSHEGEESVVVVGADHKEQETFEIRPPECPEEGPPSAHNPLS